VAHLLLMPEVAADTAEAVLGGWSVPEGGRFRAGTVLAVVETAKAAVDVEAEDDGVLIRALVGEGSEVAVGTAIALLAASDEHVSDVDAEIASLLAGRSPGIVDRPHLTDLADPPPNGSARTFASPLARRLARDGGLALADIRPTGPHGRIVRRDVEAALGTGRAESAATETASDAVAPANNAYRDQPHSRMRRAIAAGLTTSKQTVPHFYLRATAEVDKLLQLRNDLNDGAADRITLTDLLVKAVAVAHTRVPAMNVIWTPDAVRQFATVDIAVAVAVDGGLVTLVLHDVATLGVGAVSSALADLTARAHAGALHQHELEGGTCTVTNLGMHGADEFTAIINPPQSSILAIGAVRREPLVRNDSIVAASVLRLTLSIDHRPIDGVVAADWMRNLVTCLENPVQLLR
jgi:pyruvate dehydrogenase E2 component (dihydrolipoamide acetyltransferase)